MSETTQAVLQEVAAERAERARDAETIRAKDETIGMLCETITDQQRAISRAAETIRALRAEVDDNVADADAAQHWATRAVRAEVECDRLRAEVTRIVGIARMREQRITDLADTLRYMAEAKCNNNGGAGCEIPDPESDDYDPEAPVPCYVCMARHTLHG